MGNCDKKVGDYVGKCSGQTHKLENIQWLMKRVVKKETIKYISLMR